MVAEFEQMMKGYVEIEFKVNKEGTVIIDENETGKEK